MKKFYLRWRRWIPLAGYIALTITILLALLAIQDSRAKARQSVREAITLSCQRVNELSNQRAQEIYDNYRNLERNLIEVGLKLTPHLRALAITTANDKLTRLSLYDCRVFPPEEPRRIQYELIREGEPIPNIYANK